MTEAVPMYLLWTRGASSPLRLKPSSRAQEQALLEALRRAGEDPNAWLHWGAAGGTAGGVQISEVVAYLAEAPA